MKRNEKNRFKIIRIIRDARLIRSKIRYYLTLTYFIFKFFVFAFDSSTRNSEARISNVAFVLYSIERTAILIAILRAQKTLVISECLILYDAAWLCYQNKRRTTTNRVSSVFHSDRLGSNCKNPIENLISQIFEYFSFEFLSNFNYLSITF